jgi:hypothetical protein
MNASWLSITGVLSATRGFKQITDRFNNGVILPVELRRCRVFEAARPVSMAENDVEQIVAPLRSFRETLVLGGSPSRSSIGLRYAASAARSERLHRKAQGYLGVKWLTNNGGQHKLLEDRLRDFLQVPSLSLFNNGTIALLVACQSQRLSGEVITTPFTFPATPHVLSWNNVRPVFCDIDPVTMNIDPRRIESMITPQTTGILAVHVFGTPCDVGAIQEIADRYRLRVVYDAAHAFGVEIDGRGIGTFGDVSCLVSL